MPVNKTLNTLRKVTPQDDLPESLRATVDAHWEAYLEAAGQAQIKVPRTPEFVASLRRVWACSDFVAQRCINDPAVLQGLLRNGDLLRDYTAQDYVQMLAKRLRSCKEFIDLGERLRLFRQREMVRIAWRDIAGWADLDETLRDLSMLAQACIQAASQILFKWQAQDWGKPKDAQGKVQSLIVLGMGKLGAGELNFSSDIDLIFTYPQSGETRKTRGISNEEFFTQLGQRLVQVLNNQTMQGFVFRVDMRLRPFGDSGALVSSFDALEDYYQRQGREWERYALIKARPVAGDPQAGEQLMKLLTPFIYRRYLDFGVLESLREMKELIVKQVRQKGMANNIKLGRGGIREVEFIGQAFQLIRGGREPQLRTRPIQQVLRRLTDADHLPAFVTERLITSYRFLRRVENRLQEWEDGQTHLLPEAQVDRVRLAYAMGYREWALFEKDLNKHRDWVDEQFQQVFSAPQREPELQPRERSPLALVWADVHAPQTIGLLREAGFDDPQEVQRLLAQLREGHVYRVLTTQGRGRLNQLIPLLLGALVVLEHPSRNFARVLQVIETVARRSVYLSLLVENPMALSQLVKLSAASPWIPTQIAQTPLLLDELLDARTLYHPLCGAALADDLLVHLSDVQANDVEGQMEQLRQFKHSNVLRVAAADVMGVLPLMVVSDHLTEIAEVITAQALRFGWAHVAARGGVNLPKDMLDEVVSPGFGVIAYGKFGGIELSYGSDLDLVFVHANDQQSPAFYARIGQRMIHLFSTLTPSGVLYEIDMRLRPSGNAGLLVSSIEAFTDYQTESAWTWEHQALVRARFIVGDPELRKEFERARNQVLTRRRDEPTLRAEVKEMRARMRTELSSKNEGDFDLKQDTGGIVDIEFMVQYGVLRWACDHPGLVAFTDNVRLLDLMRQFGLLPSGDATFLSDTYRLYRRYVHQQALQALPAKVPAQEFADMRARVCQIWTALLGE